MGSTAWAPLAAHLGGDLRSASGELDGLDFVVLVDRATRFGGSHHSFRVRCRGRDLGTWRTDADPPPEASDRTVEIAVQRPGADSRMWTRRHTVRRPVVSGTLERAGSPMSTPKAIAIGGGVAAVLAVAAFAITRDVAVLTGPLLWFLL